MQISLFWYFLLVAKCLTNEIQARAIYCQIVNIQITLYCQETETTCM